MDRQTGWTDDAKTISLILRRGIMKKGKAPGWFWLLHDSVVEGLSFAVAPIKPVLVFVFGLDM